MTNKNDPGSMTTRQLRARRRRLARSLPDVEGLIAGSVVEQGRRCGKEGCRCATGQAHGPYTYVVLPRSGGRAVAPGGGALDPGAGGAGGDLGQQYRAVGPAGAGLSGPGGRGRGGAGQHGGLGAGDARGGGRRRSPPATGSAARSSTSASRRWTRSGP